MDREHVGEEAEWVGLLATEVKLSEVLEGLAIRGDAGEEVGDEVLIVRNLFHGNIIEDVFVVFEKEVEAEVQGVIHVPVFVHIGIGGEAIEVVDEDIPDIGVSIFLKDKDLELIGDFLSEATGVVLSVDIVEGVAVFGFNGDLVVEGSDGIGWKGEFDGVETTVDREFLLIDDGALFPEIDNGVILLLEGTD